MTARHSTPAKSDNSGPSDGQPTPAVSTSADAQRAIAALEQSNGSLYETTLVHRLGLTRACVGSVVDELADIGVVTVRRGQGDNQIVLNPMRLSEVREQEAQDA